MHATLGLVLGGQAAIGGFPRGSLSDGLLSGYLIAEGYTTEYSIHVLCTGFSVCGAYICTEYRVKGHRLRV